MVKALVKLHLQCRGNWKEDKSKFWKTLDHRYHYLQRLSLVESFRQNYCFSTQYPKGKNTWTTHWKVRHNSRVCGSGDARDKRSQVTSNKKQLFFHRTLLADDLEFSFQTDYLEQCEWSAFLFSVGSMKHAIQGECKQSINEVIGCERIKDHNTNWNWTNVKTRRA